MTARDLCLRLLVPASAALLVAGVAIPAQAASVRTDPTPQCYSYDQLYPDGTTHVFTACTSIDGRINDTATPNGNIMERFLGTETQTLFIDGVLQPDATRTNHARVMTFTRDGTLTNQTFATTQTFTYNGQVCTVSSIYHYSNGQIRVQEGSSSCS